MTGLVLALAVLLAGYGLNMERLFRPLADGPATHPLTATALALLGLTGSLWSGGHLRRQAEPFAWVTLALGVVRLSDIYLGTDILGPMSPFQTVLAHNKAQGTPIATGANTAAMTILLGASAILNVRRHAMASQILAALGLGFPAVSLAGYAYGLSQFYGRMALATAMIALPVGIALLLASAQRGFVRAVLSPWIGGRIARLQLLLGISVPFLLGFGAKLVAVSNGNELYGLLVVLTSLFIGGLITYTAMVQESVDHARRVAERLLRHHAGQDPLTGLPNRRHLLEQATYHLARAARDGTPLALLILDIDHFKRLNDEHGHLVGDQVLICMAALIQETVRRQDIPARYGGEEFLVLLPNTQLEGAVALAEKLRSRIEAGCADRVIGGLPAITASIGCAEWVVQGQDLKDLIRHADLALYRAKAEGRNRVEPPYHPALAIKALADIRG